MIMESKRGQKGDIYNGGEVSRRSLLKKRPPRYSWQPTVPSWEKTFCKVVGSLDWEVILDMKKFVHLYDNVVKWNDSAGEEAFHNAKNRFLAKMRGLPCDVSPPNPDLYIDEVDWDSKIDPELLLDLDRDVLVPSAAENHETVVIFGDTLICNEAFSTGGWGESEENLKKATYSSCNNHDNQWDDSKSKEAGKENGWGESGHDTHLQDEGDGAVGDAEWGVGWENSWCLNNYDNHGLESKTLKGTGDGGVRGTWDVSNGNRNNAGRFASRYNTSSRFHGNDHQGSHKRRNGTGRRTETFVREHWIKDRKLPSKWWNVMNSCGPVNHDA